MDNFDPYNVLLVIATNIPVTYDCFCAPGSHIIIKLSLKDYLCTFLNIEPKMCFNVAFMRIV